MTHALDAARVHTVVASIPSGHVAAYGQIAELAGYPGRARWVGRLMASLPADSTLPWHRVVSASGLLTLPNPTTAIERLKAEGVRVSDGRVSMRQYRWHPGN